MRWGSWLIAIEIGLGLASASLLGYALTGGAARAAGHFVPHLVLPSPSAGPAQAGEAVLTGQPSPAAAGLRLPRVDAAFVSRLLERLRADQQGLYRQQSQMASQFEEVIRQYLTDRVVPVIQSRGQ
ncbi:MAG: hypothetical protein ACYDAY_00210 [Candidatus Dormibacteria bacterium]